MNQVTLIWAPVTLARCDDRKKEQSQHRTGKGTALRFGQEDACSALIEKFTPLPDKKTNRALLCFFLCFFVSLTADDADVLLLRLSVGEARACAAPGLLQHLVAHLLGLLLQHRLLLRDPRPQLVRHLRRGLPLPLQ